MSDVTELRPGQNSTSPETTTETTTAYAFVLTLQVSLYGGRGFMLQERSGTTQVVPGVTSRNRVFVRIRDEAIQELRAAGYEGSVTTVFWSLERDTLL